MMLNGSIRVTSDMTVGDLRRQLEEDGVPDHAKISLYIAPDDRFPGDGQKEIQVSWDSRGPQPEVPGAKPRGFR